MASWRFTGEEARQIFKMLRDEYNRNRDRRSEKRRCPECGEDSNNENNSKFDKEGRLTLDEANEWYRRGEGQTLMVDASKLNLNMINKYHFPRGVGSTEYINLLFNLNIKEGLVYGSIGMTLLKENKVSISDDIYDFDIRSWDSFGNIVRNTETIIGSYVAGEGKPYKIKFKGRATIGKPLKIINIVNYGTY